MRKQAALGIMLALSVLAMPAQAQRTTAELRGTVTDPSRAIVPGAAVTVRGEETGLVRRTSTNSAGLFTVTDLPVGSYRVDIELSGFKPRSVTKIALNVGDVRVVDVELEPGAMTDTVTVEANAVQVQTVGGEVAGLITGEQVRELPLNGRNFLQLATLMPGVSAPDFLNVKDKGLLGGSDLSVSGSAVTSNMWTVDGANNNDVGSNRSILVYPSVDAIEEFKIERNSYGPEYGGAGGAQVNIVTRGGTNEFHGSTFYSGRNDALDATNYFLKKAGQPKDALSRHDFGWTLGGPIKKDKLQFFVSQEWNIERRGTVRQALVPTDAERNGDFSGPVVPGCSSPTPTDPLTGQPFAGNKIPADRLSPGGQLLLQLYPHPNRLSTPDNCNNWVTSLTTPINWRQENARVDWTISNSTRLMLRYTQDSWSNNSPNLQSNLWGDDPFPAVDSNWDQPGRSFVAQLSHSIGTTAVNTLEFSYSGNKIDVTRGGTNPGLNGQINAAIPSLFPDSIREYGADRGHPVFDGAQGYGEALTTEAPFHNNQDLFALKDDYSAVFGTHNLKAGVLFSINKKNEDVGGFGSFENTDIHSTAGFGDGTGPGTGNILADLLLRGMAFNFSESSAQRQVPQRWKDFEAYLGDSWKVAHNVTLDYGVRYSLFLNPYAADNKVMSFDPTLFNPALGADPCNGLRQPVGSNWCQQAGFLGGTSGPNRSLVEQDYNNFAPRLGIAWDVHGNGRTAVRAGVGQFYLRERLSPGLNIGSNPPFVVTVNGVRQLDTAAPPCPDCFSTSTGTPNAGRETKALTPSEWQWNLMFEQQLARNTTLEIGYVGSRGLHLLRAHDANQVRAGDINGNGVPDRLEYARTDGGLAEVRPYGVFGESQITLWDHSGDSIYHSLQAQVVSRFGRSQFQASYTFSKTIANDPLDNSDGGLTRDVATTDLDNPRLDRGLARTDRRHVFNASLVLATPTLEGKSGLVKALFGNWEIGTITQVESGIPITVYTGEIPGLPGGVSGTGYVDNQRPNRVDGQPCTVSGGPREQFLNPAAFTLDGFQIGTIGNSGRGVCTGPGLFQVDLSLYKNITVSKSVRAQLRFEVFNVLNHTNFTQIGGVTMDPIDVTYDTGDPTTATQITHATLPSTFGQATGARDARQAQFGVKLIF